VNSKVRIISLLIALLMEAKTEVPRCICKTQQPAGHEYRAFSAYIGD
jgi:hypothetical protein